jgi:hypothetical protein
MDFSYLLFFVNNFSIFFNIITGKQMNYNTFDLFLLPFRIKKWLEMTNFIVN